MDLRQSKEYGQYMESLGWQVEGGMFIKKIWLFPFCFAKYQRPNWPIDIKKLFSLIKKCRVILFKIEPNTPSRRDLEGELKRIGFKKDKSPMLPTKTIVIDLSKSEKQLLKEMHSKTRYNIKKYRKKVRIIRGDKATDKELERFYKIYLANTRKQKFWGLKLKELTSLVKCFGKKAYLLMSGEGGLVLLVCDKTAYYSHNAATKKGKQEFLPTILTFEAIKLAKKTGCVRFDFEGIEDERYPITNKWAGFSRFKKGFGGNEVEYMGSFGKINLR